MAALSREVLGGRNKEDTPRMTVVLIKVSFRASYKTKLVVHDVVENCVEDDKGNLIIARFVFEVVNFLNEGRGHMFNIDPKV